MGLESGKDQRPLLTLEFCLFLMFCFVLFCFVVVVVVVVVVVPLATCKSCWQLKAHSAENVNLTPALTDTLQVNNTRPQPRVCAHTQN